MRQIRELLRLEHACQMSDRLIGDALGMGRTNVGDYLRRLAPAGMTLVTSQITIERWYDIIAKPTIADAILDRLVQNAHKITLKEDAMRKQNAERLHDSPSD